MVTATWSGPARHSSPAFLLGNILPTGEPGFRRPHVSAPTHTSTHPAPATSPTRCANDTRSGNTLVVCSPKMQWWSLFALADVYVINSPTLSHTRSVRSRTHSNVWESSFLWLRDSQGRWFATNLAVLILDAPDIRCCWEFLSGAKGCTCSIKKTVTLYPPRLLFYSFPFAS